MSTVSQKLTFNPSLPVYTHGKYNSFVMLRFFDTEEHREYFRSGKLYMRSQTDFSSCEMGEGRVDVTEGANVVVYPRNNNTYPDVRFEVIDGKACVKIYEYSEKPEGYRENQIYIGYPVENQRRNVFCMYGLWFNSENENFVPINVDEVKKVGQYGVVITDFSAFINRVGNAVNKEDTVIKASAGFVNYVDESDMQNVMDFSPFIKPAKGYDSQNEFRICAYTDNIGLLELKIEEGLRDITIPIKLNDFAKSVHCEAGQLVFETDEEEHL